MATYQFLTDSKMHFDGNLAEDIQYITDWQLKDVDLWAKFVQQFRTHSDSQEGGWRGEFWGKMMRGACLTWRYTQDDALYSILEHTVRDLLTTQDLLGRISTYTIETEFTGWDLWCRKYVLTGLQHFYDICTDESLKVQIVDAMCAHADAIIRKIGKGKIEITETSTFWGAVNSCSILEPIVRLYDMTRKPRYLEFAQYILSTGGCKDGNLIETALEGKKLPHEFPTVKAYEVMSFFEGALAYYEVTGEQKYFEATQKFIDLVMANEISVIGCSGCEHELFDHTVQTQTTSKWALQQETCVTVTWMRVLSRLALLTGDVRYAHALELSAYNAMPSTVNYEKQKGFDYWITKKPTDPLPFDSYSPLVHSKHGNGTGGIRVFAEGGFYGCCGCIGSAGLALRPLMSFLSMDGGFVINDYYTGTVATYTPSGAPVTFTAKSSYVKEGDYHLALNLTSAEAFTLRLRIPAWCKEAQIRVGQEVYTSPAGYLDLNRQWTEGDSISIHFPRELRSQTQDGMTSFSYGPLTLCWDALKIDRNLAETDSFALLPEQGREQIRMAVRTDAGTVLLTDYASCGKNWNHPDSDISVWL